MKRFLISLLICIPLLADTPSPGVVGLKGATDNTPIGNVSDALKVEVVNSGGTSTVNQGTGGASPWLISGSTGRTWSLLNSTDSVNVGNFPSSFSISNFPSSQAVTGTFFQSVQPVSQSGSFTTGRTWSLLNSTDSVNVGNFPSSFAISNFPSTQAVTGTFFQATQPVSGNLGRTWSLNSGTDSVTVTGSISASNPSVGTNGSTSPTSSTLVGAKDGSGNLQPLAVNGSNALKVDGSAVTQPVSGSVSVSNFPSTQAVTGTFFQATQPVSGTVGVNSLPSIPAGANAIGSVSVSNFPATQPISAAALPLPTGAATSANQPALGTAGSASTDVLTVQGIASMTALKTDGSGVTQPVSGTVSLGAGTANIGHVDGQGTAGTPSGGVISVQGVSSGTALGTTETNLGQKAAASSQAVTLSNENVQDLYVTGQSAQTATVNNILTVTSGTAATDLTGYRSASVQVVSTGTAGTFIFEGSNDNVNFQTIPVYNQLILTGTPITAAITAIASQLVYVFPVNVRYVRLRIATTITGGSIQAFLKAAQTPFSPAVFQVAQNTAANLATTATIASGTVTTVSSVTSNQMAIPGIISDVASAAITTTTTTGTLTPTFGNSYQVNIPVTAVSGTTPTMDVEIQESRDTGTNWVAVYDFPRITATGSYNSPLLPFTGNRVRYVQTISGATPSFTRAINRLQSSQPSPVVRQIVDRTVSLTTLNSTTPSLVTEQNTKNVQVVANIGATTIAPILQIQASDDAGATWYNVGGTLTTVASSTVQLTVNNMASQLYRVNVSTAGTGTTAGYVLLKAF